MVAADLETSSVTMIGWWPGCVSSAGKLWGVIRFTKPRQKASARSNSANTPPLSGRRSTQQARAPASGTQTSHFGVQCKQKVGQRREERSFLNICDAQWLRAQVDETLPERFDYRRGAADFHFPISFQFELRVQTEDSESGWLRPNESRLPDLEIKRHSGHRAASPRN